MINKVYGLLGLCARMGKIVSGMDAVEVEIKKKSIELIIVAEDASEKTIKNVKYLAENNQIQVVVIGNIFDNSKAIGKENRAVIAIKDKNIAEGVKKIIFGGEAFGQN